MECLTEMPLLLLPMAPAALPSGRATSSITAAAAHVTNALTVVSGAAAAAVAGPLDGITAAVTTS